MIDTAMILCAGFGTRLNELTKTLPKPMLAISGKPILEYSIKHLINLGIKKIVINLHYLHETITDHFGDGTKFGVKIIYSYEEKPLGTAGALKKVKNVLYNTKDFFVLYGDIFTNENFIDLYNYHISKENSVGTIVLHKRINSNSIVEMDENNKIIKFLERPDNTITENNDNWVNSGLYCFNENIFDFIPENMYYDFPKDVFPEMVSRNILYGYPIKNYRCAIDSEERYYKAQSDYIKKKVLFEFER